MASSSWLLIILYLLPQVALWFHIWMRSHLIRNPTLWACIVAALLLGAGLALLGAAYLHDVWYC